MYLFIVLLSIVLVFSLSACKYKDVIPADSQSLEAVLIQSELQNKVRQLLDTPLPVPDKLPENENMAISFEKGFADIC